jgi:hypothetical protein
LRAATPEKDHTMPTMDEIRQGGTPFDPFLYATVGDDRNGNAVTMLSTLARLGLEPWEAAAELAGLTRAEAGSRLDGLLARFRDVPALSQHHAATTRRLIALLPGTAGRATGESIGLSLPTNTKEIGPIIAVLILFLYIVFGLFFGSDGAGN